MGKQGFGIDPERLSDYARQIKEIHDMGVEIGIVIGGGGIAGASYIDKNGENANITKKTEIV